MQNEFTYKTFFSFRFKSLNPSKFVCFVYSLLKCVATFWSGHVCSGQLATNHYQLKSVLNSLIGELYKGRSWELIRWINGADVCAISHIHWARHCGARRCASCENSSIVRTVRSAPTLLSVPMLNYYADYKSIDQTCVTS